MQTQPVNGKADLVTWHSMASSLCKATALNLLAIESVLHRAKDSQEREELRAAIDDAMELLGVRGDGGIMEDLDKMFADDVPGGYVAGWYSVEVPDLSRYERQHAASCLRSAKEASRYLTLLSREPYRELDRDMASRLVVLRHVIAWNISNAMDRVNLTPVE